MTRTGLICGLGFGVLVIAGGWYWHHHSRGGGEVGKQAQAFQDERQVLLGMVMYWKSHKAYPTGENPAIVQALASVYHPRADATNKAGVLIDPWGTAYEITVQPTIGPIVRSAGENKKMGDTDDVVSDWKSLSSRKP